ncbi:MAG: tyrosine-type recombinase/integrase [Bacteroidales bacterium]|nr:tyrosine-type recombinase/integrase [Bacteroidales bacterium]
MIVQLITEFLAYIKHERRYSEHTIKAYRMDLHEYADYIQQSYGKITLEAHTHLIIRSWLSYLITQGLQAKTVSRKMSSLKSFFKYCLQNGYISHNPTAKLKPLKIPQRLPVFVQEKEMQKLFTEAEFKNNYCGIRDYTILNLLYNTGMRVSELVNLNVQDINTGNCSLKVLGKRNKERIIPVNDYMMTTLETYLQERENFLLEKNVQPSEKSLFLSSQGKKPYAKLIYDIVKKYLEQVSTIDKKSPHILRHSFATHLLSHGADLNAIKELMGHANLAATQVYTHSTIDQLKSIYEQAHPKGK